MKTLFSIFILLGLMSISETAKAQLWRVDDKPLTDPVGYYADRNGTYPFQYNQNNNMGTSPNNAVYKNEAGFYNKDNYLQTTFPTANGVHYTPGSQGNNYNGNNFINNNAPGSYNYNDVNGRAAPVYKGVTDPNQPVRR